jgi:hypothetical protein
VTERLTAAEREAARLLAHEQQLETDAGKLAQERDDAKGRLADANRTAAARERELAATEEKLASAQEGLDRADRRIAALRTVEGEIKTEAEGLRRDRDDARRQLATEKAERRVTREALSAERSATA